MEIELKAAVGSQAPDFDLPDSGGFPVKLSNLLRGGPLLLAFYPKDFGLVCTKQLCNYQDHASDFQGLGIRIVGISGNDTGSHEGFSQKYKFSFPLLSDAGNKVAKAYGCTSLMMFGGISRAVFIVNAAGTIAYRYVEPTTITARKAGELVEIVRDLKKNGKI